MSIAPFSFRELGSGGVELSTNANARPFLPQGRKKEEAPPPPPPPPIFSEDQVKAAERDGYQKGFLDGVVEGKQQAANAQAEVDKALGESVEQFASQYAPMFQLYRDMVTHIAKLLPELAHGIAKKVAGDALKDNAYTLVEGIALKCLEAMVHEPKIVITVHESMQDTLAKKITAASQSLRLAGEIMVIGDQTISLPNCRIEWENGGMVRNTDALWQQVEQVVASMVASSEQEVAALCDSILRAPDGTSQDQEGEI